MATRTAEDTHWWLANSKFKFRVGTTLIVDQIRNLLLSERAVMYYLFYFSYSDGLVPATTTGFYLNTIGTWTLTEGPETSGDPTVSLIATISYEDSAGVTHDLTVTFSISDGDAFAKVSFADSNDSAAALHQPKVMLEANVFPQGYANQNTGGSVDAGGNTAYSVPLPYDNKTWIWTPAGTISDDGTEEETDADIDAYLACYSSDCSTGFFCRYVDFAQSRSKSIPGSAGAELQYVWFLVHAKCLSRTEYETEFNFGTWDTGSGSAMAADWGDLPLVEEAVSPPAAAKWRIVRADLNAQLYTYNELFNAHLDLLAAHSLETPGNAAVVPAGTPHWTFWKRRGYPEYWTGIGRDTGEDYVQKSIEMCREAGVNLILEVDVLDNIWTSAHPEDSAIGPDEVNPWQSDCPEDHSQQYPVSGGALNQPRQAIQSNLTAGSNVVVQLPAGSFASITWEVGTLVRIADSLNSEDVEVVGINAGAEQITVDALAHNYATANGAYALPLWFTSFDSGATWKKDVSCGGDGKVEYWVKLLKLVTPGEAFHDLYIEFFTDLCENYNFYGVAMAECAYRNVDYCAAAKARFMADTEATDWPRNEDDSINLDDETLGKWKTSLLAGFWDELRTIANAHNHKFFVMVQMGSWNGHGERQAWEFGQYYPTAIEACDGLWAWMYYGYFDVNVSACLVDAANIDALREANPGKEYFFSIGLWSPDPDPYVGITAAELKDGLEAYQQLSSQWSIEVTPSKMMTVDHWDVLWGKSYAPLALSDFKAPAVAPRNKIELYYSGSWKTPEAIVSDTGGQLLATVSTSLGGSDPQRSVMAGSWSAEIYNPGAVFHPLHPTSSYKDVFAIGRKVRISAGLRVNGTDYFWPVMHGIIARVEFDTVGSKIKLTGYDYAQVLADYKLREYLDLNFGGTRTFELTDGSNVVTNGTFDVDVSGWTAYNGLISSETGGYSGKCLEVETDSEITDRLGYQRAKQTLTGLVVGGTYQYSFRSKLGTQNWKEVAFVAGTTEDSADIYYRQFQVPENGDWAEITGEFIAPASTVYIALEKSSPHPAAAGSMLFDELTIHQVQSRFYPMTSAEYPSDPAAKGCFLLRKQVTAGPPATYEDFYVNEDFTWDRDSSILNFVPDWVMPAAGTIFVAYVYEAYAPEDVIFFILANCGLYANYSAAKADAIYTATGIMIDRVGFEAGTSGLEAIKMIAERCRYQFYFRSDGKPVFIPKPAIKAAGFEDLDLAAAHIADIEYIKNDGEFYNRILLTGELQDRESKDDLGDKAELKAEASDAGSIATFGEKALSIKNNLWQDQATINAAAVAFLADLKKAKAYIKFKLKSCPIPVDQGETTEIDIPLTHGAGGVAVTVRGLIRDIKLADFDRTITLEIEES